MRILGIDPGYDRLGWGVLEKNGPTVTYIACGLITTSKTEILSVRLQQIYSELSSLLTTYSPEVALVEDIFFSNNQKSVIAVAQSRGVVLMSLSLQHIRIEEMTPSQIKSIVTGDGRADKKAVEKMIRLQVQQIPARLIDDTLDALAGAYAYAVQQKFG